ncbi:cation transporter, partial [Pseudomonas sp. MPBD4-3]|uniref:cation transporter n=1 Tax=Pseudomonas sp. MPBD4-3 TaxID=2070575 RepID=UPI000CC6BFCB
LIALLLAAKPTSELRSFGLFRLEVLASFINGLLLFVVSLVIAWESIERLRFPHPVMAGPLLLVAFAGLALNLMSAAALWLAMKGDLLPHS